MKILISKEEIARLFELPLMDLLMQAQTVHREHFNANEVQISTLLSIKTGNCPEDCGYCSQSGHYRDKTGLTAEKRLEIKKCLPLLAVPNHKVHHAFVWVQLGNTPAKKTCLIWWI